MESRTYYFPRIDGEDEFREAQIALNDLMGDTASEAIDRHITHQRTRAAMLQQEPDMDHALRDLISWCDELRERARNLFIDRMTRE